MSRRVVPAVLVYVTWSPQTEATRSSDVPENREEVLMLHRNARGEADFHSGKWNGLGGKLELAANESPLECARRELREESGLDLSLDRFRGLGMIQFPEFKPAREEKPAEDWLVWIFRAHATDGERGQPVKGPEGDLHWIRASEVLKLNLWPGDRYFLPSVLNPQPFLGTIWYRDGKVERHWLQNL